jgi:hypothetical protein
MYPFTKAMVTDVKVSEVQTDHAVLVEIRETARSIKAMMLFFTILTILGIIGAFISIWNR